MRHHVKPVHFNGHPMGGRKLSPFRLSWGTFIFLLVVLVIVVLLTGLFFVVESEAVTLHPG